MIVRRERSSYQNSSDMMAVNMSRIVYVMLVLYAEWWWLNLIKKSYRNKKSLRYETLNNLTSVYWKRKWFELSKSMKNNWVLSLDVYDLNVVWVYNLSFIFKGYLLFKHYFCTVTPLNLSHILNVSDPSCQI